MKKPVDKALKKTKHITITSRSDLYLDPLNDTPRKSSLRRIGYITGTTEIEIFEPVRPEAPPADAARSDEHFRLQTTTVGETEVYELIVNGIKIRLQKKQFHFLLTLAQTLLEDAKDPASKPREIGWVTTDHLVVSSFSDPEKLEREEKTRFHRDQLAGEVYKMREMLKKHGIRRNLIQTARLGFKAQESRSDRAKAAKRASFAYRIDVRPENVVLDL